GLVRRHDWPHAADGATVLASSLIGRGRPRTALDMLDEAGRYADRAGDRGALTDIAIMKGHAWIDLAQLDPAESVLGAALAAARGTNDEQRIAVASQALGRCLFWGGRYSEAEATLRSSAGLLSPRTLVPIKAAAARVAVGLGDLARAVSLAREAA